MGDDKFYFGLSFEQPCDTVIRAGDARCPADQYWSERVLSIELSGSMDEFNHPWSREFDDVNVRFKFYNVPSGREVGDVEAIKFSNDETGKRFNLLNIDLILPPSMFTVISHCLSSTRRSNLGLTVYTDKDPGPWAQQEDPPLLNIEKFEFMGETPVPVETSQDKIAEEPIADDRAPPFWWQHRYDKMKKLVERISWIIVAVILAGTVLVEMLDQ